MITEICRQNARFSFAYSLPTDRITSRVGAFTYLKNKEKMVATPRFELGTPTL